MNKPQPSLSKPDNSWRAFARRHRGNPFLKWDPLYALTEAVIDSIKAELPTFFTVEQEVFERDLARTARNGFFRCRLIDRVVPQGQTATPEPFGRTPEPPFFPAEYAEQVSKLRGLSDGQFLELMSPSEEAKRLAPVLRPESTPDPNQEKAIESIRKMIAFLWEERGRDREDIRSSQQQERREMEVISSRQEAYAGWLVLNPTFRAELRALQTVWRARVAERGFPTQGRPGNEKVGQRRPRRDPFHQAWFEFYRRWGLDRMLTWDLPSPLNVQLEPTPDQGQLPPTGDGILLFVPWHMFRGGQLDLQEVARRIRFERSPGHLRDWLLKEPGRSDERGDTTYQRLFWIYRCHELVLSGRYAYATKKNVESLDKAMATVMVCEADWVKKLRLRLRRILRNDPQ